MTKYCFASNIVGFSWLFFYFSSASKHSHYASKNLTSQVRTFLGRYMNIFSNIIMKLLVYYSARNTFWDSKIFNLMYKWLLFVNQLA